MKNIINKKIAMLNALAILVEYVDAEIHVCESFIDDDFMVEEQEDKMEAFSKIKAHLEKLI